MPTPSNDTLPSPSSIDSPQRSSHLSCPPDPERIPSWRSQEHCAGEDAAHEAVITAMVGVEPDLSHSLVADTGSRELESQQSQQSRQASRKTVTSEEESQHGDSMTPESMATEAKDNDSQMSNAPLSPSLQTISSSTSSSTSRYEFSTVRLLPNHTSSFLRSGSKFKGTQQSDRQVYDVQVEIKHVDMEQSYLCGFLRIQGSHLTGFLLIDRLVSLTASIGLTEDHPTLTTFFEGEIIGTKHTFLTKHPDWGATEKTDMQHWGRFPAWRPLAKKGQKPDFAYKNSTQRENLFMRWKEHFLVPDHRVTSIHGASFEGFYYICFNQVQGTVSGIYFHAKSEKFQQLELKHVDDRGCFGAIEFR